MSKEDVLREFREALGGRTVLWASARTSRGDFEGRDTTLEVFDAPAAQQRTLLRRLRGLRARAARQLGAPVQVVFHTPEATARYYSWVRDSAEPIPVELLVSPPDASVDERPAAGAPAVTDRGPVTSLHRPPRRMARDAA